VKRPVSRIGRGGNGHAPAHRPGRYIAGLLVALGTCTTVHAAEPGAGFSLPGDYSEHTTVADFQARFGPENVQVAPLSDTEDSPHGLVLFPGDPSRRAYVAFHDEEALSGVASITVRDRGSRWRGKQGVHVGMSFADLRRTNGKPFYFSGFDTDLQGYVQDAWSPSLDSDDDTLGALDVGPGEEMYFAVELDLIPTATAIQASWYPRDEMSVSSDDARFPRLGELFEVTAIRAFTSLDDE
jgi:hypothetical protein